MPNNERSWLRAIPILSSEAGESVARESSKNSGFSFDNLLNLVEVEVENVRTQRRTRMFEQFDDIFNQENGNVD